ncbi:MAG: ThuA domain-containing protein [Oscillospiraceae bacterium]|nr:ThuA domain-containing protein [Oscillospiraceae bacterium]
MHKQKQALIFWGGWDGHEPERVSNRFAGVLRGEGFAVELLQGTQDLPGPGRLAELDLLVPVCSMGELPKAHSENIVRAVGEGLGLAGFHGGMCDAFRNDTQWQFMTGGQWVAHPGNDGVEYRVHIHKGSSPLVEGIEDFTLRSEHYYLHYDPAVEVLASTRFPLVDGFHAANKPVDMPVAWTKYWGAGRVYYCSLGHVDAVFEQSPAAQELLRRGMLWAARANSYK